MLFSKSTKTNPLNIAKFSNYFLLQHTKSRLFEKKFFNQALQHYLKARNATLLLSENSQKFLFYTNFNIGLLYLRDKKYDKAEKIFFNYQSSLQTDSQDGFQVKKLFYTNLVLSSNNLLFAKKSRKNFDPAHYKKG